MQTNPTEQQFLIYAKGPEKAREILDNDLPNHYRESFKKFETGKTFVWNWAAFFAGSFWFMNKRMPTASFVSFIIGTCLFIGCTSALPLFARAFLEGHLLVCALLLFPNLIIGALAEKALRLHLLKKIQEKNFDELSEKTKTDFFSKIGITEHQFLSCIYGEKNADVLMQYNVPNHYRQAFKKFACEKKCVWNWAAGLNNSLWFIYRKAPLYALMYASISLAFCTIELYTNTSFSLILLIAAALLGNYLLLENISREIQKGNYSFLSRKDGESKPVWFVILSYPVLAFAAYGCSSLILSSSFTEPSIIKFFAFLVSIKSATLIEGTTLITIIAVFIYTQYKMRTYRKTAPKN